MVQIVSDRRSLILAYNTVERLLKGDFYHFSKITDILHDLQSFDESWSVIGLGTTNWYKRNGEALVDGTVKQPDFLWADPDSEPTGKILNLKTQQPGNAEDLQSPYVGDDDSLPQFPFMGIALCDPKTVREYQPGAGESLHEWLNRQLEGDNLGLAAIQVTGTLEDVKSTAACHLPIGGIDLSDGYSLKDNFKFIELDTGTWAINGLYGINPTIQQVLSVPGHPLHLHGYETELNRGGHINQAITTQNTTLRIFPVQDINIRIRDLDKALLPVKILK
mgnify:CR=1 FL=1